MKLTDKRPGYKAIYMTPYFAFENSCMEFHYHFFGNGTITVSIIAENQTVSSSGNSLCQSRHWGDIDSKNRSLHDDVIKWKHFSRYWPFVWGIHKGQGHRALVFSLICAWTNGWGNNRDAGDLRRRRAHYDVTVTIGDKDPVIQNKIKLSVDNLAVFLRIFLLIKNG